MKRAIMFLQASFLIGMFGFFFAAALRVMIPFCS